MHYIIKKKRSFALTFKKTTNLRINCKVVNLHDSFQSTMAEALRLQPPANLSYGERYLKDEQLKLAEPQ